MSALDLIIARGFGPEIAGLGTAYTDSRNNQRAVESDLASEAKRRKSLDEEMQRRRDEFNASQANDQAEAQRQQELQDLFGEVEQLSQADQNDPAVHQRIISVATRLEALKSGAGKSVTDILMPKPPAAEDLVQTVGSDGRPVYTPKSQAAGQRPYVEPKAAPAPDKPHYTPMQIQQPDGTVQTVMVDTSNPANRIPIGAAPAKQNTKVPDAQTAQRAFDSFSLAMNNLETAFANTSTGPIAGLVPAFTENQQKAQGSVALLAPILKQLFRTAGEGVFTDKDQELLLQMAPQRTDLPEVVSFKTKAIRDTVAAKLGITPAAPAPAPAQSPAAPRVFKTPGGATVEILGD